MPTNIPTQKQLRLNRGFTLIEIVLTIVILGAVAGILVPFFNAIVRSPDPVIRERAISLGQAMMDEIMAKRWDENTPFGGGPVVTGETLAANGTTCIPCDGNRLFCFICRNPGYVPGAAGAVGNDGDGNRIDFDDVDDYNGLNEADNFTDQNGAAFAMPGYRRQVTVSYIASATDPIDQNTPAAAGITDTKLVLVTIRSPLGEVFNFIAVACNI
jgi:MSHA pilin protein MshD